MAVSFEPETVSCITHKIWSKDPETIEMNLSSFCLLMFTYELCTAVTNLFFYFCIVDINWLVKLGKVNIN